MTESLVRGRGDRGGSARGYSYRGRLTGRRMRLPTRTSEGGADLTVPRFAPEELKPMTAPIGETDDDRCLVEIDFERIRLCFQLRHRA